MSSVPTLRARSAKSFMDGSLGVSFSIWRAMSTKSSAVFLISAFENVGEGNSMSDPLFYSNGYPVTRLKNMRDAPEGVRIPGRRVHAARRQQCETQLPRIYAESDANGTHELRKRWETESAPSIVAPWRTFELSYGGIPGTASPFRLAEPYKASPAESPFFSTGV